jgi:hypothetical protein
MKFIGSPFYKEVKAVIAAIQADSDDAPMAVAYVDALDMSDKRTLLREAPSMLDELGHVRAASERTPSSKEAMNEWLLRVTT